MRELKIQFIFFGAISRYSLQSFIFLKKKNKRIFIAIGAKLWMMF
jgi:hypothetical protein